MKVVLTPVIICLNILNVLTRESLNQCILKAASRNFQEKYNINFFLPVVLQNNASGLEWNDKLIISFMQKMKWGVILNYSKPQRFGLFNQPDMYHIVIVNNLKELPT